MKKGILRKALSILLIGSGVLGLAACASDDPVAPTTSVVVDQNKPVVKNPNATSLKDKYEAISIAEAKRIALENGEDAGKKRYTVYGTIKSITNPAYGEMTITDGVDELYVYGTYSADGKDRYPDMGEDKPVAGDEVILYTLLGTHSDKPEAKSSWIYDYKHIKQIVDPSVYEKMNILEARGAQADKKLQVSGVVASITYANGMKPNGFMLVDDTAAIYVFSTAAGELKVGNKITIAATKVYYINPKEAEGSAKWGYKGANQLADAIILENDKKTTNEFNRGVAEEATVKQVLNTPLASDITSKLYKSTALVKKVPGDGFINYHIVDLDNNTFSYVYTQANGSDFAWLDEFDGKICTVYYTPLNAKCDLSGTVYRFLPIKVEEIKDYAFDNEGAAEFVNEYYARDQFLKSYKNDPELELITSVKNDLININATLSYASSNEASVKIETTNGKAIMHTLAPGSSTITITITSMGKTITSEVEISVMAPVEYETISVAEAISKDDKAIVTLKGIVGPSLLNKDGFYLMDETGTIAVQGIKAEIAELQIGDEVILRGTKDHKVKPENVDRFAGQANIFEAQILENNYGEHELPTNTIIKDKTFDDVYALLLDVATDHTTEVYQIEAKLEIEKTGFSTNVLVKSKDDDTKAIMLYKGGNDQVEWLKEFNGKTVTVELALCNWNDKDTYKCCILSVISDGAKTYNKVNLKK